MATKTTVYLLDDVSETASDDVKTVDFALDGITYEIDLNDTNEETLRNALAVFIEHGRKAKGGKRKAKGKSAVTSPDDRDRNARIREAAKDAGVEVNNKGRIPTEVKARFSHV